MLVFFLVTGLLIFILLPPLIFTHTEGWTYEEGLYFAFISLSTIGFGDYVIGKSTDVINLRIVLALIVTESTGLEVKYNSKYSIYL